MKKNLLTLAAAALTALSAMANEHTLVFDGDNEMYGFKRQDTTDAAKLDFSEEISFTEAGIDFSIKKASETGSGFALVNAGGTNAGLYVYSGFASSTFVTPEVTLTVPGGNITAAKVYMSGSALAALELNFNGKDVESVNEGTLYYWAWSSEAGTETLKFTWNNTFYGRFIHSIELTYTADLQGKQECGLAFSRTEAEAIMGTTFTPPTLSNPHGLPVTWSSSDESVATVDTTGKLTLLSGGKTVISVATEGDEVYAPGNAKYDLSVIPSAADIPQMPELAPDFYDRVMVNFPMTVTYANGAFAFVTDPEGNAGYIEDMRNAGSTSSTVTTVYKVGDVVPAGWIATNATVNSNMVWQGIADAVTETVTVTYPEVNAVTPQDANKVVILKNVTFTTSTPIENTKAYGTTPDGGRYEFQDTYDTPAEPAGTYDVTCIVRYSKRGETEYFYLSPIAYKKSDTTVAAMTTAAEAPARWYTLQGTELTAAPASPGIYVKAVAEKASKVIVK